MKALITILSFALSFGSIHAAGPADNPFVKFASAEEEIINPFDNNLQVLNLGDTIRKDHEITESEFASASELDIEQVIAQDIKITEAVLPVYQPLDWGMILRSNRVVKPQIHINTNL